jgi:pimeloyl-ACP methyl ester carboxylesterase
VDLPVPGHRPAVLVAPRGAGPPPWPVVLILHGNFDRPEWECTWWQKSARPHGWLLCPRGVPRPGASRRLDRWTYPGSAALVREVHAALDHLAQRFPGRIREDRALLIGFSLGAILSGRVLQRCRLRVRGAVLVEGGAGIDIARMRIAEKRGLQRVAYLCGERSGCRHRVPRARRRWRRAGVQTRLWIMPDVGHGYSDDFEPLGRKVLRWVTGRQRSKTPARQDAGAARRRRGKTLARQDAGAARRRRGKTPARQDAGAARR